MMMSKMMMIVLMIPTIDKTDQQYQQHLTTPTTHHAVELETITLHCIGSNKIYSFYPVYLQLKGDRERGTSLTSRNVISPSQVNRTWPAI